MIEKIISGGQSGADLTAIWWAWNNKIPCEINAEYKYRPLNKEYHPSGVLVNIVTKTGGQFGGWQERRRYNVINSDYTLIFVNKSIELSKGSLGTERDCQMYSKPYFVAQLLTYDSIEVGIVAYQLESLNVKILNVAGNRDLNSNERELEKSFLSSLFKLLGKKDDRV